MNTIMIDQHTRITQDAMIWIEPHPPRDLGDGLVLRFATPADTEQVAQLNGRVFGRDRFDEMVAVWTRDFMSVSHPSRGASNVTLVEDTRTGQVVSSMVLIPQTWTYAGIPFGVGRPETVATDPNYRRRGLIRAQFEVMHAKSAAMGHLVQGITGIPWYYRQFGYEYALDLGGGRLASWTDIPRLKEGEDEPYRIRPMTMADIPFAAPLYERECSRSLVACRRSEELWRGLFTWYSPGSFDANLFRIIETLEGRPVGYFAALRDMWQDLFPVNELTVVEGQSLRAVMPTVLREMERMAQAEGAAQKLTVKALRFVLGREHPVYSAIPECLPCAYPAYGWYIRVADVPGFLRHIAPALEARLARSPVAGHTGELKISEYTRGFRLVFEHGRLAMVEAWKPGSKNELALVEDWKPDTRDEGHAALPPLVFLQLLFGFRSLAELRAYWPDCWVQHEAAVLLDILFPKQASHLVALG